MATTKPKLKAPIKLGMSTVMGNLIRLANERRDRMQSLHLWQGINVSIAHSSSSNTWRMLVWRDGRLPTLEDWRKVAQYLPCAPMRPTQSYSHPTTDRGVSRFVMAAEFLAEKL